MIAQQMHQTQLGLQQTQSHADAVAGTNAEGHVGIHVDVVTIFGCKAFRVILLGLGPVLQQRKILKHCSRVAENYAIYLWITVYGQCGDIDGHATW